MTVNELASTWPEPDDRQRDPAILARLQQAAPAVMRAELEREGLKSAVAELKAQAEQLVDAVIARDHEMELERRMDESEARAARNDAQDQHALELMLEFDQLDGFD